MKNILKTLAVGILTAKAPKVGKAYDKYEKYAVPLIRAQRYYGHNKKAGLSTEETILKAATDAKVPVHLLTELIAEKTGDIGKATTASVLQGTMFDPGKSTFKKNF